MDGLRAAKWEGRQTSISSNVIMSLRDLFVGLNTSDKEVDNEFYGPHDCHCPKGEALLNSDLFDLVEEACC